MSALYLLVDLAAFTVPFIFSFHPKLAFYKQWKFAWPAIVLSALPFIAWDSWFTACGYWGFNDRYLLGPKLGNLPLEEVLFFICIPYACLFTYHCLCLFIKTVPGGRFEKLITGLLLLVLCALVAVFPDRLYTLVTSASLAGLLIAARIVKGSYWLFRFCMIYLILLVPFFIVNGILTGTGLQEPVVWYNNEETMRVRLLTIPFEDVFYGMALILINALIFEFLPRTRRII